MVFESTRISGLSTVHLPCVVLRGIPITPLMVSLCHLLYGSSLLISQTLDTPFRRCNETFCTEFQANFRICVWVHPVPGIHRDLPCQRLLSGSSTILEIISSRRARRSTKFPTKYWAVCVQYLVPVNLRGFPLNVAIWIQFTSDHLWASSWLTKNHDDFKRMTMNGS